MAERTIHATAERTLERGEDGWYEARCICGFARGPLPDLETTVDELMDHARLAGLGLAPSNLGGTDG